MADEGVWISIDEAEDVAASVRQVLRCWDVTSDDPQTWKWVVLALHATLQGACVCHLSTTAHPVGALTEKNTGEWLNYFEVSREDSTLRPPGTKLLALPDLVKRIRKVGLAGDGVSPAITVSDSEFNWLRKFHDELRNQFVHFKPMGWSIEITGMAGLAKLVARVVGDILDAGWGFRLKDDAWRDTLRADLARLSFLA